MPDPHHSPGQYKPGDDDATVLPLRPPTKTDVPATKDGWRVTPIDTEPMNAQHYDLAVTTLAALITRWKQHHHDNTNDAHHKAA